MKTVRNRRALFTVSAAMLALACTMLLTGCAALGQSALAQSAAPEPGASAASESTSASGDVSALNYEAILPVEAGGRVPAGIVLEADGTLRHYTMERDGAWGLLRMDGAEVLPCAVSGPVNRCWMGHWSWLETTDMSWDDVDIYNARLAQTDDGMIGCGHGGASKRYVVLSGEEGDGVLCYAENEGNGTAEPASQEDFAEQGGVLPVQYSKLEVGEMTGYEAPVPTGEGYNFARADGTLLGKELWDNVGWFEGEALAPVEKGGKWAYIAQDGTLKTDYIYDGAWGANWKYNSNLGNMELEGVLLYASPLHDGYAPVVRDGKWGVLNAEGKEVVPCEYEGAALHDGGYWLKENGAWTLYTM